MSSPGTAAYARTVTSPNASYSSGRISRIVNAGAASATGHRGVELRTERLGVADREPAREFAADVGGGSAIDRDPPGHQGDRAGGRIGDDGRDLVRTETAPGLCDERRGRRILRVADDRDLDDRCECE